MLHGNTLWFATKILIVQSTEKRLICLKTQVFQTTKIKVLTSQATVARIQATALMLQTARIKVLTNQATVLMQTTKVLTALMQVTAVTANKY